MTSFPYFSGASSCLASASHPCSNLFSPLSVVSSHASHRHLTSAFFSFSYFRGASLDFGAATHLGATCFPHFPGCQPLPRMHIPPLAFFSFSYFRGAPPCLHKPSHLCNNLLSTSSGVPDPASYAHLTTQTSPSPAFRGAPLCHTDLGHLSLQNYFCGAENAQDFLRRR